MEIKTTGKSRDSKAAGVVPPPDSARHGRRKATNKLGKSQIAGRRVLSALKVLGKFGAFVLMIACIFSLFFYAYTSDKFNLRTTTFYGCKETSTKHLNSIIQRDFPANILRIDLRRLKERLERETWVRQVEIRRVLPSELIIYVWERTPSVILEFGGDLMLADSDGIMLCRYHPKYGQLDVPVFKGVVGETEEEYRLHQEENTARIRQGLLMLAEIEAGSPQQTRRISEVDISDRENLTILLVDDTAEVILGEKDYRQRFRKLLEGWKKYQELKQQYTEFESIDLRFEGDIIYRPRRASAGNKEKTQG